jgi:DNA-binding beta-propeller fold protein YncE
MDHRGAVNGHARNCGCGDCLYGPFTRNHYFTGKLLVERDFNDEQLYYMDKHLLHQQRLHGEGVVCGLQVVQYDNPNCRDRFVCVMPGLAIDCCGHDILVKRKECIDITQFDSYEKLAQTAGRLPHTLQICIRYRECPTEEVPVLYDECGCDNTACAPNRILESYDFDLIVDPTLKTKVHCVPTVAFKATLPIAGSGPIVARNAVYVLAPNLRTITKFDLAGTTVQGSLTLPGDGRALAISEDGKTLYVAGGDASPATKTELWAINTTVPLALPAGVTLAAAPAASVELRVAPATPGMLLSLNNDTGELIVWDVTTNPAIKKTISLAAKANSLIAGNKGLQAYAVDPTANVINVVDLATSAVTKVTLLTKPSLIELANTTTPDILFVTDGTGPSASALKVDTPKILGTEPLPVLPTTVLMSPDDQFAYLAMVDSSGATTLRPIDVERLIAGTPEPPGDGPVVQPSLAKPVITPDGFTIFYPEINATTQAHDVAILTVTPHVCPDLYEVADCPQCDPPDCIVLCTIQNYQPGFLIEDLPALAGDFAAHIARIDNRLGRRILPSTQKIAEVLECLLECNKGGIPGPKGDPGADGQPGKNGDPGLGLNVNLPKIIDIGWKHADLIAWDDFRTLYEQPGALDRIKRNPKIAPLVLYFNEIMQGVDRQTYRVSLAYPQAGLRAPFCGLYNIAKLDFCGTLVGLGPGTNTPHTNEPYASAWAFLPAPELFQDPVPLNLIGAAWNVFLKTGNDMDLPYLRIVLSGDFVFSPSLTTGNYDEARMLDANNIGGQVGLVRTRGTPFPASPKNPSGDLVEGGNFEGWFFFKPPEQRFGGQRIDLNEILVGAFP